ncbi:MAG: hypothetical protein HY243_10820 [Proteobacteria bacterium]|nr:hypothetical protein [Pseudomonadota bacterium]
MAMFGAACGAAPAAKSKAPPKASADWSTYKNPELGYSISTPKTWNADTAYVYSGFGPDHDIHGVAFAIPESLAQGTNLSTSLTAVSVESVAPGNSCDATRFLPDAQNLHVLKQDGRTWSVADSGEGAAGNFYETTVFALSTRGECLGVRYLIHSTNIGNYDPGTVREFDRKALLATFDRIRRSLKLAVP